MAQEQYLYPARNPMQLNAVYVLLAFLTGCVAGASLPWATQPIDEILAKKVPGTFSELTR